MKTLLFVCLALVAHINFNLELATATDPNYISPTEVSGAKTVTAQEAKALFDKGAIFVDVRKDSDWNAGRIPGALHLEYDDKNPSAAKLSDQSLKENKVDKLSDLVIYCNGVHCARSSVASVAALSWGYKNVYYFRLGFPEWKTLGYPFE